LKQSVDNKNIGDFFLIVLQKKMARDERAMSEDPLMAIILPGDRADRPQAYMMNL
jgi:hypothetical protein